MAPSPFFAQEEVLPFSCHQLFDLVADVRSYPTFLPWCLGARVREISPTQQHADLLIGYGPLRESYTSLVTLHAPTEITATQVEGPFQVLNTRWQFTPHADAATHVCFVLDLVLKSGVAQKMLGALLQDASRRMMDAFKERAFTLYGASRNPNTP